MEVLLVILIVGVVAVFVTAPLWRGDPGVNGEAGGTEDPRRAELEARKEAKYREIRDAEIDCAQGKLTEDDFRRQDAELRAEAIAILKELDRVQGKSSPREKETA